ncbi:hypothetical protein LSH36_694g01022 [Paralvinella palmiformis]|uniref:mitogen-activated protein kinase n=1 Tax=Paralvinella palmiformis TaxID=53620 RepID=A0AAD9MV39_9ANNE|nr:hypothetical protein LSH36_694g01022 [Paralvinella palmiformis]
MSSEIEEHITNKYEIKKRLGKGAYGIVWKAIDKRTGEVVALKKIFDAFRNQTDAQRTFREIMFLQEFGDHPNIVKLHNVLKAENDKDIYLVFEFMDTDLHNVIKRGNILKDVHKRYIMYQLLKATKYMHSGNVIHRDQKPSNVLLDGECYVKVCDFGLARSLSQITVDEQGDPNLTEYVATRWYRAPEILLASHKYTKGVDMWSLGCILGEMLLGKPLFPGSSTLNQIERILSSVDPPTKEDVESIESPYGASVIERASKKPRKPIRELVPDAPDDAIDLLRRLLHFNPDKRPTAEEVLKHPYVKRFHNPADEKVIGRDVVPPLSDDIQLTVEEYRNKLYEMILQKKLERRRRRRDEHKHESQSNNKPDLNDDHKEQALPPSEPSPVEKTPSPSSPLSPPHYHPNKTSPGKTSPGGVLHHNDGSRTDNKPLNVTPPKHVGNPSVAFGRTTHQPPPQYGPSAPPQFQGRPRSQFVVRQKTADNPGQNEDTQGPKQVRLSTVANFHFLPRIPNAVPQIRPVSMLHSPVVTASNSLSLSCLSPSGSRPPSRQTSAPVVGRVATPVHSRTNSAGSNFSKQAGNPVITRELGVTSSKLIPHQRPPSGKAERPRPVYGKKQFENTRNAPTTGAPRGTLGGYTQSYGTITASGLQSIQARKW